MGKPLIAWTIEQSLASKRIDRTIVSTDDVEIAEVSRMHGALVPFIRPSNLAQDNSPTEPTMIHAVEYMKGMGESFDAVILLQPTSPLRMPESIDTAVNIFESSEANSLLSVCENHHFFWMNAENPHALYDYKKRPRRQDIAKEDRWYRENGSIYITKVSSLIGSCNRLCEPITMYLMSEIESFEIDSTTDFKVLESLLANR